MKKHILIIMSLVAGMAACSRPELADEVSVEKDNVIVAELENGSCVETKTTMKRIDNGLYRPVWSQNDRISVWNADETETLFTLTSGAGSSKGVFEGVLPKGRYVAYYPFETAFAYDSVENMLFADFPSVQKYREGTYDDGAYPMIAVAEGSSISFKNVCSVLKVSLKGTQTVNRITFVSGSDQCLVSGLAYVRTDWTSSPELTVYSGESVLTLDCGDGVTLDNDVATDFYLVLPAQTYVGGFTLKISTDAGDFFKSTDNDVVMSRSQLRAIPPFSLEENQEVEWKRVYGPYGEEYGSFMDNIVAGIFSVAARAENHKVEVYERTDLPGYYRFDNIYSAEFVSRLMYGDEDHADECAAYIVETQFIVDATVPTKVFVPIQPIGFKVSDDYGWMEAGSLSSENGFDAYSFYGMREAGVITFPVGGMFLYLPGSGYYQTNDSGLTGFILPGMDLAVDYSVGEPADGKVEVAVDMGHDLDCVKIAVVEGRLSDEQIAEYGNMVASGQLEALEMRESGTFVVEDRTTGQYTVVLVAVDRGMKVVSMQGRSFGYVAAGEDRPVTVAYEQFFRDEWTAEGYSPENMIGIRLSGRDITWFNAILYTMSVIEQNSTEAIKNAMMSYQSHGGEEGLALINSTGYELRWAGLEPGTDYCLAICAGNGYHTELFLSVVTTEATVSVLERHYDMDDITVADKADYCGVWDFYASDYNGDSSDRVYAGAVTVTDGGTQTDAFGLDIDCFEVSGLFAAAVENGILDSDTILWEYYEGYIMPLHQPFGKLHADGVDYDASTLGLLDAGFAYADGGLLGGFTADGNIAFVDTGMYSEYGPYVSYMLCAFLDGTYAGYLLGYDDMMFLPQSAGSAAVATKAMTARPDVIAIERNLNADFNYVQPVRVQLKSAIDKMKRETGAVRPCGTLVK